jgi:hypothetical protein
VDSLYAGPVDNPEFIQDNFTPENRYRTGAITDNYDKKYFFGGTNNVTYVTKMVFFF